MEAPEGRGGIASTHSWPRHYMGMSGQRHPRPLYLQGNETRYPLHGRLGGPQRPERKSFAPAGYRTPVVQSVVRHYIDSYPRLVGLLYNFFSLMDFSYKLFKTSFIKHVGLLASRRSESSCREVRSLSHFLCLSSRQRPGFIVLQAVSVLQVC
jgi:hypothetical protein